MGSDNSTMPQINEELKTRRKELFFSQLKSIPHPAYFRACPERSRFWLYTCLGKFGGIEETVLEVERQETERIVSLYTLYRKFRTIEANRRYMSSAETTYQSRTLAERLASSVHSKDCDGQTPVEQIEKMCFSEIERGDGEK